MNAATETLADIVAELRFGPIPPHRRDNELLRGYADRLEAARKREEEATAEKSSTVGNAASMRKALLICDAITQFPETISLQAIKDMRNIICRALSAPPRNCDVYATAEEAHFAFCAEPCEKPCGNCTVTNVEMAHDCFIKWLLAPATEQKGEGDGQ